jgi:hypothetical protein
VISRPGGSRRPARPRDRSTRRRSRQARGLEMPQLPRVSPKEATAVANCVHTWPVCWGDELEVSRRCARAPAALRTEHRSRRRSALESSRAMRSLPGMRSLPDRGRCRSSRHRREQGPCSRSDRLELAPHTIAGDGRIAARPCPSGGFRVVGIRGVSLLGSEKRQESRRWKPFHGAFRRIGMVDASSFSHATETCR